MKRFTIIILVILVGFAFISCKKNEFKGYKYDSFSASDDVSSFLSVEVQNKDGKQVCWFHMLDQTGEDNSSYDNASDKVGKYPASVNKDSHVWILVAKRFEIRLVADNDNKEFQKTEKLKKFLMAFDLKGLEKIKGAKVSPKKMSNYLPKLM